MVWDVLASGLFPYCSHPEFENIPSLVRSFQKPSGHIPSAFITKSMQASEESEPKGNVSGSSSERPIPLAKWHRTGKHFAVYR